MRNKSTLYLAVGLTISVIVNLVIVAYNVGVALLFFYFGYGIMKQDPYFLVCVMIATKVIVEHIYLHYRLPSETEKKSV